MFEHLGLIAVCIWVVGAVVMYGFEYGFWTITLYTGQRRVSSMFWAAISALLWPVLLGSQKKYYHRWGYGGWKL